MVRISLMKDGYEHLLKQIKSGGIDGKPIDLVLSCVDNYAARMTINTICNETGQIWFESGVSEDALSSHVQLLIPGQNACFACASPLAVVEENEANIKREGVCAASLPTTMAITAGLLAQGALKLLLEFGDLSHCFSYNARKDFCSTYDLSCNPDCQDKLCRNQQQLAKSKPNFLEERTKRMKLALEKSQPKKDFENEWGIEMVTHGEQEESKPEVMDSNEKDKFTVEDLAAQLKGL